GGGGGGAPACHARTSPVQATRGGRALRARGAGGRRHRRAPRHPDQYGVDPAAPWPQSAAGADAQADRQERAMTIERPPRLEHDAELGAIVRASKDVHVGPERLANNAARIKTAIAAGGSFAAWKLLFALLLIGGAVAVTWWLVGRDEEPRQAPALVVAPTPDAAIVTPDAPGPEVDD